ncbi:uncharacterized protein LOC100378222 [Saccoglossus kowalevskii]|uniref:F-box/LRR-repeat protein 20-like n=1 Tax=Saccoglossus kowalevskii TaxID=10224 RepID=A0ABM0GR42_SACKO|nr:PREDICTED: F-box/LRR-repeat protein 20-like [Saccoglossus kowalevskii]
MLKNLTDMCLVCLSKSLHLQVNLQDKLPTKFKEILIERLAFHDQFTLEYLPFIVSHLFAPTLKRINFYECDQINDTVLLNLAECGCQFTSLRIDSCAEITDIGLHNLLSQQRHLETLELIFLPEVCGWSLNSVKSPVLAQVIIQEEYGKPPGIDNESFCNLVANNKSLYFVCIHKAQGSRPLNEEQISRIIQSTGERLYHFYLTGNTEVSDHSLQVLAENCPNLKTLKLRKVDEASWRSITEKGLKSVMEKCRRLADLNLYYYYNLFSLHRGLCVLPYLPKSLFVITLDGSLEGIDEDMMYSAFTQLPHLYKLDVNIDGVSADVVDKILSKMGKQLQDLKLSFSSSHCTTMHSVIKSVVQYCINLKNWTVYTCEHIDGTELYPVLRDERRANNLKLFKLWPATQIKYDVLLSIVNCCKNLDTFTICNHNVDDDIVLALSQNTNISCIDLNGECNELSEEALCKLVVACPLMRARFPRMKNITDKLVKMLAYHSPYLDFVRLSGWARISEESIQKLRDSCIRRVYIAYHPREELQ